MIINLPEILKKDRKWKARPHFKPIKQSKRTELWYREQLLDLVKSQRQAVENALKNANNPLWVDSATVKDNQSSYDRFLLALNKYKSQNQQELAQKLAEQLAHRADEQNRRETAENIKRQTGVDLQAFLGNSERVQERLQQLTTANVALIKSIPTQYLDKVELAVTQAIVKGELNSELAQKIYAIGQSTESRAKLIARDQASKFNAALTQARHEDLGITHYRWSTSGDERVRESHIENDGKIFAYDDPPKETGNPGFSINCRCVAIPVLDKGEIERAEQVVEEKDAEIEKELPKDFTSVIDIGKSIHHKYENLLDEAIEKGKPYEGIMEIMRREGVELGGIVKVSGLEKRAVNEITETLKRYPKHWVEKSNATSGLVVKEYKARAFQMKIPENWDLDKLKTSNVRWGKLQPLASSIKKGLVKNGDSFIVSNTNHPEALRLSRFIHEYGHKLQSEMPELDRYFAELWLKRTNGKPYTKYNGETIKDGNFPHPYYGRDYGNADNPQPKEMLTMTFEALLGNDPANTLENLRKKDPELFNLGLALLTRYK